MQANRKSIGVAATLAGVFLFGFMSHDAILTGGSALLPQAHADAGTNCSVRTLNSAYGIKFEGSAGTKGQYASVSRVTFDGGGNSPSTRSAVSMEIRSTGPSRVFMS